MKHLLIFVLLLVACSDVNFDKCTHSEVTISDALPIQFWPSDCDTYNEKEVCGVHQKCFCQPWNCEDDMSIQFTDSAIWNYVLRVINSDLETEFERDFSHQQAYPGNGVDIFEDYPLSGWTNEGSGESWAMGSNPSVHIEFSTAHDSKDLVTPVNVTAQTFECTMNLTVVGDPVHELRIAFLKDGIIVGSHTEFSVPPGGPQDITFDVTTTTIADKAAISVFTFAGVLYEMDLTIHSVSTVATADPGSPVTYSLEVSPEDESICNQKVQFFIDRKPNYNADVFENFPIEDWSNEAGANVDWSVSTTASAALTSGVSSSDYLESPNNMFIPAGTFDVSSEWTNNNTNVLVDIDFLSNGVVIGSILGQLLTPGFGIVVLTESVTLSQNCDQVRVRVRKTSGLATTAQMSLMSTDIDNTEVIGVEVAKSDCIYIQNSHPCTTLIEYTNNRNFAGLVYEDVSPTTIFKILVPAIFFHERFPEEDNVIEVSDAIIHTSGQVKAQRLLETDYLPYYMHRKLKLILKHQTVLIDNQYWTKEESYDVQDGERRWPVKKGKCFLTEKNYVQRAIL